TPRQRSSLDDTATQPLPQTITNVSVQSRMTGNEPLIGSVPLCLGIQRHSVDGAGGALLDVIDTQGMFNTGADPLKERREPESRDARRERGEHGRGAQALNRFPAYHVARGKLAHR